ncbi:MAG: glycosyltransferase [Kiritimatiellae bacterium]|nr:glycosyltransferase [Kiritimatiellia bacterium]
MISVIVPVFQIPSPYLSACAASLRSQPLREAEFLFVLDGPDPAAQRLLEESFRGDPRFVLLPLPVNGGVSRARNSALERIRGNFFCFLDADDTLLPDALSVAATAIRRHPRVDAFLTPCIKEHSSPLCARFAIFPAPPRAEEASSSGDADFARYVFRNVASACGKFYSSALLPCRFPEDVRHFEDLCFVWEFLGKASSVRFLDVPVYLITGRPGSASRSALSPERIRNGLQALQHAAASSPPPVAGTSTLRARQTILLVEAVLSSLLDSISPEDAQAILPDLRALVDAISSPPYPPLPFLLRISIHRRLATPVVLSRPSRLHRFLLWSHYRLASRSARNESLFLTLLAILCPPAYPRLARVFRPLPLERP